MNKKLNILVLLIFFLTSFGLSARDGEPEDIDEKLERGRVLYEAGNLLQAAEIFEEVVVSQPGNEMAKSTLFTCYKFAGIVLYGQSRCQDAIDSWRKALVIDPQNREIKDFIARCKSEIKAITCYTGERAVVTVNEEPSSRVISLVPVDSNSLSPPSVVNSEVISADEPAVVTSHRKINFGLSYGIAIGTGSRFEPKAGRAFMGYLSYSSGGRRLAARLDGIYSHFYADSFGTTTASRYLGVSGLTLSGIISPVVSPSASIDCRAGSGVYEIILTEPNDSQYSGTTRKSSVLGINFGLGWHKNIGTVAATVEASYTHLYSSLSPNLVQIYFGISSK